ncbi:MAG: CotH kinase family protein, partial [Verrucomicrobiota bacterium]
PKQSPDVSYGRVCGEPEIQGYFLHPTPGKPNESSGPGFAPNVAFTRPSGSFVDPFTLALSCLSTNAVIRYTLDGQLPSHISPAYRAPILLTNTTCVRVRAYQDGLLPGPPKSETYLLLATNVLGFSSTLPVMVMDTFGSDRATSSRSSFAHLSFYEPVNGKTSFKNRPAMTTRGGFHVRGSSTAEMPQTSFAVQFLDEFNHEQHLSPLGLPANSDWVLYAPNDFDRVMIHNPFVHQLSRDLGRYSPRTRFMEVYLVQHPGPVTARDYYGLYVLEEKIKVGRHRVAIDRLGPDDLKPPEVTGGYLVKFDRLGPGEGGFWAGGASMVFVEPKEPVIELPQRAPQRQYIQGYFNEFDRVLRSPNWKDPVRGYRAYIDVDSWVDFHVLEVLSGNVDVFAFSTYFYKPRDGKITYGPHWDFDRALGSTDHRDAYPRRWNTGRFFDAPWWSRLFSDPDFWQLWVDRWQALRRTNFSEAYLFGLIDRLTDEVREAQPREVRRWGLEPRGGSYQREIDWMKSWLSQRMDFIDQQLVQPPQLSQAGGRVVPGYELALTGPAGATVYYTLDGTDPRLAQGAISSNAVIYTSPIALSGDAKVVSRARNPNRRQTGGPPTSTPWSSPMRADFTVAPR